MKHSIFFFAVLACSFIIHSSYCQSQPSISKGRILTTDGKKILFQNLSLGESSHRYQPSGKSSFLEIPAANTVRIEQQVGSETLKWGLICGLSGLAGSFLGVSQAKNEVNSWGYKSSGINATPIILGMTAISAAIGAWVGSGKKKYKTVYANPKYNSGLRNLHLQFDLAVSNNSAGVSVQLPL